MQYGTCRYFGSFQVYSNPSQARQMSSQLSEHKLRTTQPHNIYGTRLTGESTMNGVRAGMSAIFVKMCLLGPRYMKQVGV